MGGLWPDRIVVGYPALDHRASLNEAHEDFHVEALVAELAIERLDEGVLGRFNWRHVMPFDAGAVRPFQHGPRG